MKGKADYRDESRLRHMCLALSKVVEKSAGITRDDLVEGEDNTELIIHYLTILGEAANHVSDDFVQRHENIEALRMKVWVNITTEALGKEMAWKRLDERIRSDPTITLLPPSMMRAI